MASGGKDSLTSNDQHSFFRLKRRTIPNYVSGAKVQKCEKSIKDLDPDELDYYQDGRNEPKPPDANYVSAVKLRKKGETVIFEVAVDEERRLETTRKNFAAMFNPTEPQSGGGSIPMSHDHKEMLIGMGVGFTSEGLVDVDAPRNPAAPVPNEVTAQQNSCLKSRRPFREQRLKEEPGQLNSSRQTQVGSSPSDPTPRRRPFCIRLQPLKEEADRLKTSSKTEGGSIIPDSISKMASPSYSGDPGLGSRPFRAQRLREEAERLNGSYQLANGSQVSDVSSTITDLSCLNVSLDGIEEETREVDGSPQTFSGVQPIPECDQWEEVTSDFTHKTVEPVLVDETLTSDNWNLDTSSRELEEGAMRVDQWNTAPGLKGTTGSYELTNSRRRDIPSPSKEVTWKLDDWCKSEKSRVQKAVVGSEDEDEETFARRWRSKMTRRPRDEEEYYSRPSNPFARSIESASVQNVDVQPRPTEISSSNKVKPPEEAKSKAETRAAPGAEQKWEEVTSDYTKQNIPPAVVNKSSANDDWELPGTSKTVVPPPALKKDKAHAVTTAAKKKDLRFKIPLFTVPDLEGDPENFATALVKKAKNKDDMILVCVDKAVEEAIMDLQFEMWKVYHKDTGNFMSELKPREGHYYALQYLDSYKIVHYFRVLILRLLKDNKAFVFYCDLGNESIVSRADLLQLHPELTQVPQRAVYAQMYPGPGDKVIGIHEKDEAFQAEYTHKTYKIQTIFTGHVRKSIAGTSLIQVPRALVEFKYM